MKDTKDMREYAEYLFEKELSEGTISIYVRQAHLLLAYLDGRSITRKEMIQYKRHLIEKTERFPLQIYTLWR